MSLYSRKGKIIFIVLVSILLVLGVPIAKAFFPVDVAFLAMLIGFAMLFFFLLEIEQERVIKGIVLIFVGILFGIYYPEIAFSDILKKDPLNQGFKEKIDIFKQFCVFASAGAGGSIIAAHADKYSTDNDAKTIQQTVVDKTQEIQSMKRAVDDLSSKLTVTQYGMFILLVVLLISMTV